MGVSCTNQFNQIFDLIMDVPWIILLINSPCQIIFMKKLIQIYLQNVLRDVQLLYVQLYTNKYDGNQYFNKSAAHSVVFKQHRQFLHFENTGNIYFYLFSNVILKYGFFISLILEKEIILQTRRSMK